MQAKILQKCIDALNSEKPDLSYIKGMLETLIDLDPQHEITKTIPQQVATFAIPDAIPTTASGLAAINDTGMRIVS